MNPKIVIITISRYLLLILLLSTCNRDFSVYPGEYIKAAKQNIDPVQLKKAVDKLRDVPGFKSIVLGRNGVIAVEEYFNNGGAEKIHDMRSVTKSVMGLLIGIAIEKGFIQSIDQTVGKFFIGTVLDTLDPIKAQITISNLLTMSCGLEWHELDGGNSYSQWYRSGDHVKWVLDQQFIHDPGNGFNYNTGSIYLLSVILSLATGQSALEFARTYLFEPMNISTSDWTFVPVNGIYNNGGAGLSISPHSMFAIGNLMLNGGKCDEVQIVPENWVTECITEKNITNIGNPYGEHYGYLWWVGQANGHNHFYGMGWGGQFIVCVPDHDLVVTTTCEWSNFSDEQAGQNWVNIFLVIMEDILPAVKD